MSEPDDDAWSLRYWSGTEDPEPEAHNGVQEEESFWVEGRAAEHPVPSGAATAAAAAAERRQLPQVHADDLLPAVEAGTKRPMESSESSRTKRHELAPDVQDPDHEPPALPKEEEADLERGMKRTRERDESEAAQEEVEGRLRGEIAVVTTKGPPWYDTQTGMLLDPVAADTGSDKVEVLVDKREDSSGQLVLSHKKARVIKAWERVNNAHETGEVVNGFVKCRTRGGMIVDVFGIEAFLPGSQIDVKPIRDYDQYVEKTMEFKVVKINHEFKNVVVSHKALIEADIEIQKKEIIGQLEKGQVLEGVNWM